MASRPRCLVLVAGTGTEVGKTWVSARLLTALGKRDVHVAARKPAQSFDGDVPGATDAETLAAATGELATEVCPPHRCYELAMAPFMAAEQLGRPLFTVHDLMVETKWPADVDVGVVESVGGVRSPISSDAADSVALALLLDPDLVVLVADAGLGTINAVRLCVDALENHHDNLVVILNRFEAGDTLHEKNRDWLRDHLPVPIVVDLEELVLRVLVVARARGAQDGSSLP